VIVTLLPYLTGMTGLIYLATAVVLGAGFIRHAVALRRADAAVELPMKVFRYSINYLMLLFAALLVDHYLPLRF
jgi:protoheme IX farnesyltransferase